MKELSDFLKKHCNFVVVIPCNNYYLAIKMEGTINTQINLYEPKYIMLSGEKSNKKIPHDSTHETL